MRSIVVWGLSAVLGVLALTGCGSTASSGPASKAASASSGGQQQLTLNAQGVPNVKGMTIRLGLAAANPHVGDSTTWLLAQDLKKWGANATFTFAGGTQAESAVVSGQLDAADGPINNLVDSGLTVFAPAQAHVDYLLVGAGVTSIKQLKGKSVGIATPSSPDELLLPGVLATAGLKKSDVHLIITNGSSNTLNAMLTKRLSAGFIHADGWLKLQHVSGLHILASAAQIEPWDADSFWAAEPGWLKAHPVQAEAVDYAWLAAAKTFDTNTKAWVQAAETYTHGAFPAATVTSIHDALLKADPWPDNASAFSTSIFKKNYDSAKSSSQIKGMGNRPMAQLVDTAPWRAALALYKKSGS